MLKIGIGPSSSHTLGPWKACLAWLSELEEAGLMDQVTNVSCALYGSLALTGKGHASDLAIMLGLNGFNPEHFPTNQIEQVIHSIKANSQIRLNNHKLISFNPDEHIKLYSHFLPAHPNGMILTAHLDTGQENSSTYYSVGGGFIIKDGEGQIDLKAETSKFPYPINAANDLLQHCKQKGHSIAELVFKNEMTLNRKIDVTDKLDRIWKIMLESMYIGCHTEGILPGGLNVNRRAAHMHEDLYGDIKENTPDKWLHQLRRTDLNSQQVLKALSCFALSVNEVNASMGRIVTAPTNGSAGVIPAVLMYFLCFIEPEAKDEKIYNFLLTAAEIGSIFKKGATISAALGGCQAEIGVSSSMAAAALAEAMGGSVEQSLIAAEIAMEHHLGLTCDPIAGLVQIPCIERNAMGAVKAVNAAIMALDRTLEDVKVPLDKVIDTMWQTAKDMKRKYKETSKGGLAVAVNLSDC